MVAKVLQMAVSAWCHDDRQYLRARRILIQMCAQSRTCALRSTAGSSNQSGAPGSAEKVAWEKPGTRHG